MDLERIVDVVVRGFSAVRSRTHPYPVRKFGALWFVADAPGGGLRDVRNSEWFAVGLPSDGEISAMRAGLTDRYRLCIAHGGLERDIALEASLKKRQFAYVAGEPIFVCDARRFARVAGPAEISRVSDETLATAIGKLARGRQIAQSEIGNDAAAGRLFVARVDGVPVGWVSSIRIDQTAGWVSNLFVVPTHRRRGIGSALMRGLLRDDRSRGISLTVLTSSKAGAGVYEGVGFRQVGLLQVFRPIGGRTGRAGLRRALLRE